MYLYGLVNQDFTAFISSNQEVIKNMLFTESGIYNDTKFYERDQLYKFINLVRKNVSLNFFIQLIRLN